jgi:hypothetical protein
MDTLSIRDVLGFVLVLAIFLIPLAKILSRAGRNPWMVLLWPIPIVGIMLLWSFAFGRWPALARDEILLDR